jgi:hypothetical protein
MIAKLILGLLIGVFILGLVILFILVYVITKEINKTGKTLTSHECTESIQGIGLSPKGSHETNPFLYHPAPPTKPPAGLSPEPPPGPRGLEPDEPWSWR